MKKMTHLHLVYRNDDEEEAGKPPTRARLAKEGSMSMNRYPNGEIQLTEIHDSEKEAAQALLQYAAQGAYVPESDKAYARQVLQ